MKQIKDLKDQPNQNMKIALADGSLIDLTLNYWVNQQGWVYTLKYKQFSFFNRRIVTSPNMLRQFKKMIPFGFSCTVTDSQEPVFLKDFLNGRVSLWILDSKEVQVVEKDIIGVLV